MKLWSMFNNISWAEYALALTVCMLLYYGLVLLVYYRKDILHQFSKPVNQTTGTQPANITDPSPAAAELSLRETHAESLPELLLSLQALIRTASTKGYQKEELLLSLQLELRIYKSQTAYPDKDTINEFIISECKSHCSMHLDEYEVRSLWG